MEDGYGVAISADLWQEGYWEGGSLIIGRQIQVTKKSPSTIFCGTFCDGNLHGFGTMCGRVVPLAGSATSVRYVGLWQNGSPGRITVSDLTPSVLTRSYDSLGSTTLALWETSPSRVQMFSQTFKDGISTGTAIGK
jgi:hypothetical protein